MVLTGPITLQESEVELNVAAASALLAPGTGESTLISQASCWILSLPMGSTKAPIARAMHPSFPPLLCSMCRGWC